MPEPPAHLYFDEDVSVIVAAILRARGFEVVTTRESGRLGLPDAEQLAFAAGAGRAFLTHNRSDFERLHRECLETGRAHAGIIIARRRLPRDLAAMVGRLLGRLSAESFKNQLFYV